MGELAERIDEQKREGVWYQLVLFEAMLFTPYFTFEKYKTKSNLSFNKRLGNQFLQQYFCNSYPSESFISDCKKQYNLSKIYIGIDGKKIVAITVLVAGTALACFGITSKSNWSVMKSFKCFGCLTFNKDLIKAGSKIVAVTGGGMILLISGSIYKDINNYQLVLTETAKMLTVVQSIFIKQEEGRRYIERIVSVCDEKLREIENDITNLNKDIPNASANNRDNLKEKKKNAKKAEKLFKKVKRKTEDALISCNNSAIV